MSNLPIQIRDRFRLDDMAAAQGCYADAPPLPATREMLLKQSEAAQNAALLLGGAPWLNRVQNLLDDLADPSTRLAKLERELIAFDRLLALEGVDDLTSPDAFFFTRIEPGSEAMEGVCWLHDQLEAALNKDLSTRKFRQAS